MRLSRLAVVMVATLAASCTPASPPPRDHGPVITVASDLPLSAGAIQDAMPMRAAIALAFNDHGPINGFPLVYQSFDDALVGNFHAFKGEQNVRMMVSRPEILAMIGPYNSPVARLEIPVANEAGLAMISPSNTTVCLTSLAAPCTARASNVNNYFRIAASDSAQASAAASFAMQKLSLTRFAVLTDGSPYGRLLTDAFAAALKANGGSPVFRANFSNNAQDYSPLLREARTAGAEAVFVGGLGGNGACRVRAGMSGVFPSDAYMLSGDFITEYGCTADAGSGANDHLLAMVSASQPAPTNKVFQEFKAHGIRATTYAFAAYDSAQIIIDAIGRAVQANGGKLPSRRQVLDALADTRNFAGVTGTFSFQPNGDAVNPAISVYRVQKGKWSFWQGAS
jgi:branched-chain amino acid transport system substrate-binding protein